MGLRRITCENRRSGGCCQFASCALTESRTLTQRFPQRHPLKIRSDLLPRRVPPCAPSRARLKVLHDPNSHMIAGECDCSRTPNSPRTSPIAHANFRHRTLKMRHDTIQSRAAAGPTQRCSRQSRTIQPRSSPLPEADRSAEIDEARNTCGDLYDDLNRQTTQIQQSVFSLSHIFRKPVRGKLITASSNARTRW